MRKEGITMASDNGGVSVGTVLLAIITGALAGAVAALLLTPQSGQESRDKLRTYARRAEEGLRDIGEKAGQEFEKVVHKGREVYEENKSVLTEAFDAGREAMRRERERPSEKKSG